MREERLREGMENTHSDNTLELTKMKINSDACCATELLYEQRVNTTLENMQKKASR